MTNIPPPVLSHVSRSKCLSVPGGFFLLLFLASVRLSGQACNDFSVIALDEDCSVEITPDMVLEGIPNDSAYVVHLTTLAGAPIGTVLTAAHLGDTVRATVTHTGTGNSC